MSYAITRPARSPAGVYYEVAASPRGDLLLWLSETGPGTWFSGTVGVLGLASLAINKTVFRGRWRTVVRQALESRSATPSAGVLWQQDVRKRDLEGLLGDLVRRIEAGSFVPETATDDVV